MDLKTYTGLTFSEAVSALCVPFPEEALSERPGAGKGPALTGVEVAYVVERLNEVFGPCGLGWFWELISKPEKDETGKSIFVFLKLQYRFQGEQWSAPVYSYGHSQTNAFLAGGDAAKSAVSDGLKKAASFLGVALDVYKGNQTLSDPNMGQAFIEHAREQIKGVDPEAIKSIMAKTGLTKDTMIRATTEQQVKFFQLLDAVKAERERVMNEYEKPSAG